MAYKRTYLGKATATINGMNTMEIATTDPIQMVRDGDKVTFSAPEVLAHITDVALHTPTKATIGLGNVENYAVNEMPPTYIRTEQLEPMISGETMMDAFSKIATVVDTVIDDTARLSTHLADTSNPHQTTKAQVGLGEVENYSVNDAPPSYTKSNELAPLESGERMTVAMGKLAKAVDDEISHHGNTENPHSVTKSQVGLGNVPNVATNDQTPTYTTKAETVPLESGEKLSEAMGKISRAVLDEIDHHSDTNNPHYVTKNQVGLGNVPNVTTNNQQPTYTMASTLSDLQSGETLSDAFGKLAKSVNVQLADHRKTIDGVSFSGSGDISHFAVCSTLADVRQKEVVCTNYELKTGSRISVKFANKNTASNATLKVGSTDAKPIVRFGTTGGVDTYSWEAGSVIDFVYDGTNYVMIDSSQATTSTYGKTKLSDATNDNSTVLAATANAVKKTWDMANPKVSPFTLTATDPIVISSNAQITNAGGDRNFSHKESGVISGTATSLQKGDTTNQTPSFGGTFKVTSGTVDRTGHVTNYAEHSVKIPTLTASTSIADGSKIGNITINGTSYDFYEKTRMYLGGSTATANATTDVADPYIRLFDNTTFGSQIQIKGDGGYIQSVGKNGVITLSHKTSGVTAASKGDTTNQTPSFGGTFKVTSGTVDNKGHLTAFADHTVTFPSTKASTGGYGITQLSSATNSNSEELAATPKAVKAAYDPAVAALPKAGGTMTGHLTFSGTAGIQYAGSKATYKMISFIDNGSDTYGNGIAIGGGGATIVGSGESASTIAGNTSIIANGGTESLILSGDSEIKFYSNVGGSNGITDAKLMTLTSGGQLTLPAAPNDDMSASTRKYVDEKVAGSVTSVTIKATSPIVIDSTAAITTTGTRTISHAASNVAAGSYGDSAAMTPGFGEKFKALYATVNATGHLTSLSSHDVTIPNAAATQSAAGLMSAADKTKLDGIATGAKTGTVTSVATGVGLTGGTITGSGTVKANLKNGDTKSSLASNDITATASRQYAVEPDSNGKLSVNVPWSNTTYGAASASGNGLMSATDFKKINPQDIPSNANLNNYTTIGLYRCRANVTAKTLGNRPTDNAFTMVVLDHAGTYQFIQEYMSNGAKAWHRNLYDGTWGSWVEHKWTDTVYSHPATLDSAITTAGLYKIKVNTGGHITGTSAVDKSDITALGIPGSDTVYTHPDVLSSAVTTAGLYKVAVNKGGHITGLTAVAKADITALGIPGSDTNTWTALAKATASADGTAGYAPQPKAGDQTKFLRGDATWTEITPSLIGAASSGHNHSGVYAAANHNHSGVYLESVPKASSSTLGGIKVGTNLSIDSNGVLSATDTNTHLTGSIFMAGSASATEKATSSTWNAGTYLILRDNSTNSYVRITGTGGSTVFASNNVLTISSPSLTKANILGSGLTLDDLTGTLGIQYGGTGNGDGYIRTGHAGMTSEIGNYATIEGMGNDGEGICAHAEGVNTSAGGYGAHSEGTYTNASGEGAHCEGGCEQMSINQLYSIASGKYSHGEGYLSTSQGMGSHCEGIECTASADGSHAEGYASFASKEEAHAEGYGTIASGIASHAEGTCDKGTLPVSSFTYAGATGKAAHTEGICNNATAEGAHAEGSHCEAKSFHSHAGGYNCTATANAQGSFVGGCYSESNHTYAFIMGRSLQSNANSQAVLGRWNKKNGTLGDFIVGVGSGSEAANRSNGLHVFSTDGSVSGGTYSTSGADYAEYFEWKDGNVDNEDRRGRFVTLDGDKLVLCESPEEFVLGVVSGNPSIIGDAHEDQWGNMYLRDVYGSFIMEEIEIEDVPGEDGAPRSHKEIVRKVNPEYDGSVEYIPRSKRSEWTPVGMMGKLVVTDDGTAKPNGWLQPSTGGIGTSSDMRTKYRVMKRLDNSHVQILILP